MLGDDKAQIHRRLNHSYKATQKILFSHPLESIRLK